MELFFFLLLVIIAGFAYFHSKETPNVWANIVFFLTVIVIGVSIFGTGLTLPNTGVTYTSTTATITGTNYTISDTPILFGLFWVCLALGIIGFGQTIGLLTSNRVDINGRIH